MKTILVPVDFSDTSKNAAVYALNLAGTLKADKIVLYHAYQVTSVATPMMSDTATIPITTFPVMDVETVENISTDRMKSFAASLESLRPATAVIEQKTDYATMDDIDEVCKSVGADIIVMGITGVGKLEEALIGSTAIGVVKTTKTPVVIVPGEARYTNIQNIMLASDFKKVAETTPVQPIKMLLNATGAKLHVLNINDGGEQTTDKNHQQELLHSLFDEYDPKVYVKTNDSFINGINDFVEQNNINIIITIPKKHSFFDSLFKERHIKKLAFHSHVPMIYIHNEDL